LFYCSEMYNVYMDLSKTVPDTSLHETTNLM
jgi:hypothetical protein